jgi:metal-dependent amidase/aminoacylase/carboxypeptidase family protein
MKQTVPAAISIGELKGGLGPNFVAETYKITGSVRSVNNTDKDLLMGFIKSICETHQTQFKAEVKFVSFPGQRMVFNDATL